MHIITNHQPRPIIYWTELTDAERAELDYGGGSEGAFAHYKGNTYNLDEFQHVNRIPEFARWDGYVNDTFFSGILVQYPDADHVIMGWFYA